MRILQSMILSRLASCRALCLKSRTILFVSECTSVHDVILTPFQEYETFQFHKYNGIILTQPTSSTSLENCVTPFISDAEISYAAQAFLGSSSRSRQAKFLGGRVALRRALMKAGASDIGPILADEHGAPTIPLHTTGSISHKGDYIVALAGLDSSSRVGVDIEACISRSPTTLLAQRLLTDNERNNLGKWKDDLSIAEDVLLRFSFKESVYKAIQPFIYARPIRFSEVEVYPRLDGTAALHFILESGENFEYQAAWFRLQDKYWVTMVCITDGSNKLMKYR